MVEILKREWFVLRDSHGLRPTFPFDSITSTFSGSQVMNKIHKTPRP